MSSAELASSEDVRATPDDELAQGQLLWASVDSPWVHTADAARFDRTFDPLRAFDPSMILSTHLPPAIGRTSDLIETARRAPGLDPFVGPDQQALEQLLRQFEPSVG
jgi:hypothetical protein